MRICTFPQGGIDGGIVWALSGWRTLGIDVIGKVLLSLSIMRPTRAGAREICIAYHIVSASTPLISKMICSKARALLKSRLEWHPHTSTQAHTTLRNTHTLADLRDERQRVVRHGPRDRVIKLSLLLLLLFPSVLPFAHEPAHDGECEGKMPLEAGA